MVGWSFHEYYRTHAREVFRPIKGARRWWGVVIFLTGWPRAFTVGTTTYSSLKLARAAQAGDKWAWRVLAHEHAHQHGHHHPALGDAEFWLDVRAAHPVRLTDRQDWTGRARRALARAGFFAENLHHARHRVRVQQTPSDKTASGATE